MGSVKIEEALYGEVHDLVYVKEHPDFKNITAFVEWSVNHILQKVKKGATIQSLLHNHSTKNNSIETWKLIVFFTVVIVASNIVSVLAVLSAG